MCQDSDDSIIELVQQSFNRLREWKTYKRALSCLGMVTLWKTDSIQFHLERVRPDTQGIYRETYAHMRVLMRTTVQMAKASGEEKFIRLAQMLIASVNKMAANGPFKAEDLRILEDEESEDEDEDDSDTDDEFESDEDAYSDDGRAGGEQSAGVDGGGGGDDDDDGDGDCPAQEPSAAERDPHLRAGRERRRRHDSDFDDGTDAAAIDEEFNRAKRAKRRMHTKKKKKKRGGGEQGEQGMNHNDVGFALFD